MPYPSAIYVALMETRRKVVLTYFSGFEFFFSIMESFLKFEMFNYNLSSIFK